MCQDTPRTSKHSDVRPSASLAEEIRNGEPSQKSPRLPEQPYREDHSMPVKRPTPHNPVRSAAPFVFLGTIPGAGPLQADIYRLYHMKICLERILTYEYRYEGTGYKAPGNLP